MPSIRTEKEVLNRAIAQWRMASSAEEARVTWQAVEDAILALDNAAYDRAYEQARVWQAGFRTEEIARLKRDLEDERAHREHVEAERDEALKWTMTKYGRRQWEQLEKERDRLRQEREFTEHRRERAETEIERLRPLLNAEQKVRMERRVGAEQLEKERDEARAALTGERRAVEWALKGRDAARAELADARETVRKMAEGRVSVLRDECLRANRLAQRLLLDRDRLRSALETLADRHHFELCRMCSGKKSRQECRMKDGALRKAVEALAGESEPRGPRPFCCVKCIICGRTLSGKSCVQPVHYSSFVQGSCAVCYPPEKPTGEPEIEAVLMGSHELHCADGCGAVVQQGQCAYRPVLHRANEPLYASRECARKAEREEDAEVEQEVEAGVAEAKAWVHGDVGAQAETPEAPATPEPEPPMAAGCGDCGWRGIGRHTCRS